MVSQERVSKTTTKVVPGLFYGLAIVAAIARTGIRWHQYRRVSLDDVFVIFAVICLTAATVVLYLSFPTTYIVEDFLLDPSVLDIPPNFLQQVDWYQKGTYVYLSLGWATIFSIKASFLCFFKQLIDRVNGINFCWRIVVAITAVVFVVCVSTEFIACPRFGVAALSCSIPKSYVLSYVSISLDIMTDLMIMAIPIWLLWHMSLKPRQKLSLALFLCLNFVMIIVAAVRMSGIRAGGGKTEDIIWAVLWHQIESCIAVIMVSFIAFRSAVIAKGSRNSKRRWYSPGESLLNRKKRLAKGGHQFGKLPDIPSATLTGMNTLMNGEPEMTSHDRISDVSAISADAGREGSMV